MLLDRMSRNSSLLFHKFTSGGVRKDKREKTPENELGRNELWLYPVVLGARTLSVG